MAARESASPSVRDTNAHSGRGSSGFFNTAMGSFSSLVADWSRWTILGEGNESDQDQEIDIVNSSAGVVTHPVATAPVARLVRLNPLPHPPLPDSDDDASGAPAAAAPGAIPSAAAFAPTVPNAKAKAKARAKTSAKRKPKKKVWPVVQREPHWPDGTWSVMLFGRNKDDLVRVRKPAHWCGSTVWFREKVNVIRNHYEGPPNKWYQQLRQSQSWKQNKNWRQTSYSRVGGFS